MRQRPAGSARLLIAGSRFPPMYSMPLTLAVPVETNRYSSDEAVTQADSASVSALGASARPTRISIAGEPSA